MTFKTLKNFLFLSIVFSLNLSAQTTTSEFFLKSDNGKKTYNLTGKKLTVEFFGENKNPDLINRTNIEGTVLSKTDSSIFLELSHSHVRVYDGEEALEQYLIYRNGEDNLIRMSVPLNKIDYIRIPYPKLEPVDKFGTFLFVSGLIGLGSFGLLAAIKNENVPKYVGKGLGYSLIGTGVGMSLGTIVMKGKKISFNKRGPWQVFQK
ncbi:hypothetical protein [uncultured Arcticibacterium sp.]|uniref:hypothetical protein n=1 Tax=uncultured Arcticibacterium sp. TaxID=2173042 RepID=UPI0030F57283